MVTRGIGPPESYPVALVTAAGAGRRFPGKLLASWRGEPLIRHAVRTTLLAGCEWVGVVVAEGRRDIEAALAGLPIVTIPVSPADAGLGGSIAAGIAAVPDTAPAAWLVLGDQPRVGTALFARMAAAWQRDGALAVVAEDGGRQAPPTLFDAAAFSRLRRLTGDDGARSVIAGCRPRVSHVPASVGELDDIDTAGDWERLGAGYAGRPGGLEEWLPWLWESPAALATVVSTWRSAPQPVGAKMAVGGAGEISGSVSGGCVEAQVVMAGREVIAGGSARLLHFGVADRSAWAVGLACGGSIGVWVEPIEAWAPVRSAVARRLAARRPVMVASSLEPGGAPRTVLGPAEWPGRSALGDVAVRGLPRDAGSAPAPLDDADRGALVACRPAPVFLDVVQPPPRLVVVGAVHLAQVLVPAARLAGFYTVVIDPRTELASRARFPDADELLAEWPGPALASLELDEDTYVVVLTHDEKLDLPALHAALASPARYVGLLGGAATQAQRARRLADAGVPAADRARIHGPIGLDLGAVTPPEIAVSILAELVAARRASRRESAPVHPGVP